MEANLLLAALSGLIGSIVITALMYAVKVNGQKLDLPYLLGTRFVSIQNRRKVYITGLTLHLAAGAAWGALYVFLLTAMALTPNWPAGILWGFAHGIFIGVMMGILSENHPYIGDDKSIKDPGIMGNRWGDSMPYWILGLHVIYGVCTLAIYYQLMFG